MDFLTLKFSPFDYPGLLAGGTLIFFVLGWLWYNPITPIGKIWINYFPMPKKWEMPNSSQIIVMLIFQLFMGFVVAHTVMTLWIYIFQTELNTAVLAMRWEHFQEITLHSKIFATLLIVKIYMGFVFIKDLGHWYFERKPFPLVLIGVGYYLVGILGVCALLSYSM